MQQDTLLSNESISRQGKETFPATEKPKPDKSLDKDYSLRELMDSMKLKKIAKVRNEDSEDWDLLK